MEKMRNIVRIKDVPSNTIEEAIIILKENKKAKKFEYTSKFKKDNENDKNNQDYIIKEAELIISDYLNTTENDDSIFKKKVKKLKVTNCILGLALLISILL